jgi:hypothetical protein
MSGLAALKSFAAGGPRAATEARCEFCHAGLPEVHRHVADVEARALACACAPCHLLFQTAGAGRGRYRAVPDDYRQASVVGMSDVPVGVAFVVVDSARRVPVAFYPGPAGATESELPLEGVTLPADLQPDVEAVVVRGDEAFVVPVSAAYELAGELRRRWEGISGGDGAQAAVDEFFARVRARSEGRRP